MNMFIVLTEKGTQFTTPAKDSKDAIERYWASIDSTVSHIEKRCTCYNPSPIAMDRDRYDKPIKVVRIKAEDFNA